MSKLIIHPDSRLSEKASPVMNFGNVPNLARKMHAEMKYQNALGLAANQFELPCYSDETGPAGTKIPQIIVLGSGETYVNPYWEPVGLETDVAQEGCLSLPGLLLPVRRFKGILLKAMNENGEEFEHRYYSLMARVIQHECDHLQGRLISDGVIL